MATKEALKDEPILKQLSRRVTMDEMSAISGGDVIANTHYTNIIYVEDNGDGSESVGGMGGGSHPSYERT